MSFWGWLVFNSQSFHELPACSSTASLLYSECYYIENMLLLSLPWQRPLQLSDRPRKPLLYLDGLLFPLLYQHVHLLHQGLDLHHIFLLI